MLLWQTNKKNEFKMRFVNIEKTKQLANRKQNKKKTSSTLSLHLQTGFTKNPKDGRKVSRKRIPESIKCQSNKRRHLVASNANTLI